MLGYVRTLLIIGSVVLGAVPVAQAQGVFDVRFRSALQASSSAEVSERVQPPLGSAEKVQEEREESTPIVSANSVEREPYLDSTNGLIAAGGAALAASVIILLSVLIAKSRHHEHSS